MPNKHLWKDRQKPDDPTEPKPKGGGRHKNSLANLRPPWKPGVSGNPNGKSSSINEIMRLARTYCPEAIERLVVIMRDTSVPPRDTIAACQTIMDRGLGRPIVPMFKGSPNGFPAEMVSEIGADGETTALLMAAGKDASGTYKATLKAELERIETEERLSKAKSRDEVDAAAAAMERGEHIESPALRMLASVRRETH
jgi:hypothetical protein